MSEFDVFDESSVSSELLGRGARKADAEVKVVVTKPDWTTEGEVCFGEQIISLTNRQLDGAKARILRTLQRFSRNPAFLARELDESAHVFTDLAQYALKLDERRCDHWRRCLGQDWDEFFDLENKHIERRPEVWEERPVPKPVEIDVPEVPITSVAYTVTRNTVQIFAGMSYAERLQVLRNRRQQARFRSEIEVVSWQSAIDQQECRLFGEHELGPDLFKILNETRMISAHWLECRTPDGFDKAGLRPPDKRKPGVREMLVPASFVSRIVRFARTVSAGIGLAGQSHLEAELVRLERFCVDCQALDE